MQLLMTLVALLVPSVLRIDCAKLFRTSSDSQSDSIGVAAVAVGVPAKRRIHCQLPLRMCTLLVHRQDSLASTVAANNKNGRPAAVSVSTQRSKRRAMSTC
jgi:hypothetical protein